MPKNYVKVLDKGYVGLVDYMGSDLSVTSAARVSYDKISTEWNDSEEKLLNFLIREGHSSPFRHAVLSFEIYAPLFVCRQWVKHVVGSAHIDDQFGHNESSRRYVTENEEFYNPAEWRGKPENNKQGSGPPVESWEVQDYMKTMLGSVYEQGNNLYQKAMELGVAPEQARLFLPANGLYVRWRWTCSLQGVMHFIKLRDESHAQWEIVQYARAVKELARTKFPASIGAIDVE